MNMFSKIGYGFASSILLFATSSLSTAQAAVTDKDIKVVTKAIGFIEGGPTSPVEMAVVTDGGSSKADADTAADLAGKAGMKASVIAPSAIGSTSAKVLFIPAGMNGSFDAILSAATAKKLVTISNVGDCTAAQKCAISIASDPKVDIVVSKSAAAATGVSFGSAFSMMIKEVP
jgi:hypothetical protein